MNTDNMEKMTPAGGPEGPEGTGADAVTPAQDACADRGPDTSRNSEPAQDRLTVEEAFEQLEQLVNRMEEDGISLEESFACYEKGIHLIKYCSDQIDRVEKKVQMLRGEGQAPLDGMTGGGFE